MPLDLGYRGRSGGCVEVLPNLNRPTEDLGTKGREVYEMARTCSL